jgi:uncharacterized protein
VTTTRPDVHWLIGEFTATVPGVVSAVAISSDGLALGYSDSLVRDVAERLAAAGSGQTSLNTGMSNTVCGGRVLSNCVAVEAGFFFSMTTDTGETVLVVGARDCDPGKVTYELALLIAKFSEMLAGSAPARHPGVVG